VCLAHEDPECGRSNLYSGSDEFATRALPNLDFAPPKVVETANPLCSQSSPSLIALGGEDGCRGDRI
jgi:hypothetical protein